MLNIELSESHCLHHCLW